MKKPTFLSLLTKKEKESVIRAGCVEAHKAFEDLYIHEFQSLCVLIAIHESEILERYEGYILAFDYQPNAI